MLHHYIKPIATALGHLKGSLERFTFLRHESVVHVPPAKVQMHDLPQRKDPPTDSEKLANTIAYAAPDGSLWRIGEDHSTRDRGYRGRDPNRGSGLMHGLIAYNRTYG